jgi:hypothetical protein
MTGLTRLEKPTLESAPDMCAYQGCEKAPTMTVRFRDPNEYVCYCDQHAGNVFSEYAHAKYRSRLK